jgi:hypothetical protein
MNETPHDPGGPDGDGPGRPDRPSAPSPSPGPRPPDTDLDSDPDLDDDDLDDDEAGQPPGRRLLSGGRLAVIAGVAVIVVATGLALVLTSDGGGSAGEGGGGSSGEATSLEEAAFQFAECMREHGLEDFPDPQVTDQGVSLGGAPSPDEPENMSAEEREAAEACEHHLADTGPLEGEDLSPEELAERQDQALAMARCMRDRGWDMPDPEITEDGGIMISRSPEAAGIPGPGDPRQDEFRQDQQECHEEAGLETPEGASSGGPMREGQGPAGGES